jgi:lipoprotein-releasing system ATP-binding protein
MSTMSQIKVSGVSMSYENGKIPVLHEVDLEVERGSLVALCGPSGCGKSTLLHLIAGLDQPSGGEIFVNGSGVTTDRDLTRMLRHTIGFVFQLHNLIPDLTLEENCLIPAVAAGVKNKVARARLRELAERTGVDHRLRNRIQDLSGGERQRTALCRALMNDPEIILADEPTGALDEESREQVFEMLLELVRGAGRTMVMASHDRELAERCDRIVEMKDGRVTE